MVGTRQKMLEKMELVEAPLIEKHLNFNFPEPCKLEHSLINCLDMDFGYTPDKVLLRKVNCHVDMESRIGVLGANGVGKSTLIKLGLGQLKPLAGTMKLNDQARVALFNQHAEEVLELDKTPLVGFLFTCVLKIVSIAHLYKGAGDENLQRSKRRPNQRLFGPLWV